MWSLTFLSIGGALTWNKVIPRFIYQQNFHLQTQSASFIHKILLKLVSWMKSYLRTHKLNAPMYLCWSRWSFQHFSRSSINKILKWNSYKRSNEISLCRTREKNFVAGFSLSAFAHMNETSLRLLPFPLSFCAHRKKIFHFILALEVLQDSASQNNKKYSFFFKPIGGQILYLLIATQIKL